MSQDTARPIWVDAMLTLRGEAYRLWSYIYWRQGGNGCAWPSQEGIAADLDLTAEAVRKITKRLAASGWLTIRWSGPGQGHRKMYTARHPDRPAETPTGAPVSDGRNPNDGLGLDERNPNGGTGPYKKNTYTNTAKGKKSFIGRCSSGRAAARFDHRTKTRL